MNQLTRVEVTGPEGLVGTLDTAAPADAEGRIQIILQDGRTLLVPKDALRAVGDGRMTIEAAAVEAARSEAVVPVIREEIAVGKRVVESGRVRVRKVIREEQETVDEPLAREEVTVERIPVERVVSGPLPSRREGDAFVIPIVEEVLVVEKRLMLKEELWVRKRTVEERRPETVTLRREEAVVERLPTEAAKGDEAASPPGATEPKNSAKGEDGTTVARRRPTRRR